MSDRSGASLQAPAELSPRKRLSPLDFAGYKQLVLEHLSRLSLNRNEFGYDETGARPEDVVHYFAAMAWCYDHYFRCKVSGLNNVPEGKVLLVANHAGQVASDMAMVSTALLLDREPPRLVRGMGEYWLGTLPFMSVLVSRMGSLVGTRHNCIRELERGELVLACPEGVRGMNKTFDQAYQLQEFGLGFMRMALETQAPIVPVAVVGSEEQNPGLHNSKLLASLIDAPVFPITPFFPLLGPVGLMPLPTRYHLYFAPPITFKGDADADDAVVSGYVDEVKAVISALLEQGLKERQGVFG